MSIKIRFKNRILLAVLLFIAILGVSLIVIPPMINLNNMKSKIENVILTKTGVPAKIHGNVNFSLMGSTTIVAHNVSVPNGVISSVEFALPFFDIFNIKNADISGNIYVNGASLYIEKIIPFDTRNKIIVNDSKIKFLNKEYQIIHADFSDDNIDAFVRTDQHKYEIKCEHNNFTVKNKNNDLTLTGELFNDGTAIAHISIIAQNVNRWFEFNTPKITGSFPITADIDWDGQYGIKFYNISADTITGNIELKNDGYKIVNLKSNNADYNMSFFVQNADILQNTSFNLDFYGKLKFLNETFKHLKIVTMGEQNKIKVDSVIADNFKISDGFIDESGAHNLQISIPENGVNTTCLFSGTPTDWQCEKFSYGNSLYGNLSVKNNIINADIYSKQTFSNLTDIVSLARKFAHSGTVNFNFPDMIGTINISKNSHTIEYKKLDNKSLQWLGRNIKFIPQQTQNEIGNFTWVDDLMIFIPDSEQWQLSISKDYFILRGNNFKQLMPEADLQAFKNLDYVISGNYKNNNISNLSLEINDHKFTGTMVDKYLTLKTDYLSIDSFMNPYFVDNFEELSFFTNAPVLIPFGFDINLALGANKLIYKNQTYNNFVYSVGNKTQTFSITDSDRGNILATIEKDNAKYTINIQLNKFVFPDKILSETMPLNISDTVVTAEIKLKTYGKIAHDIINNLNGTFDISLNGGYIYGLGFDEFYASAPNIATLNIEEFLSYALSKGKTRIKKMHIVGTYDGGDIKTTKPFTLSMPHVDASGDLEISNNDMMANLNLILRGTSAGPEPITLKIHPNNLREFSLSEIMMHFDPEYMREFVQSHNKF